MVLIRTRKQERTLENTLHVREYLIGHPCVDCGESDPVVLEFDHVRGVKSGHISTMARTPVSLRKLQAEMANATCGAPTVIGASRRSAGDGGETWAFRIPKAPLA
jgi:hypothetical protein